MISVNDILEFSGFDRIPNSEHNNVGGTLIHDISKDDEAEYGDMCWMNGDVELREKPFSGTLLFHSGDLMEIVDDRICVGVENPRLAFIKAANEFFKPLSDYIAPIMGKNVTIGLGCSIGNAGFGIEKDENGEYLRFPHVGKVIIEDNVEIGSNVCIDRGALGNTVIKKGARIDNLVHIAHNVVVGENSVIVANAMIGGSTVIGDDVWVGPSASLMNGITIGDGAVIGMGAVVLKDVEPGATMVGNPARRLK